VTVFRAGHAWIGDGVVADVDIAVVDGVIASVAPIARETRADVELPGVVLPGFANAHSHAFHRALRGRTHGDGGTFWTWRERMYELSAVLDPSSYHALARAVYGEMALAGVTCVGEFHYVHHAPGGTPYADPNAMGEALRSAAHDAGIRLTLLDTCYLAGGLGADGHVPLNPEQLRFGDGSAAAWGARVSALRGDDRTRIGAAIHSVRAVPRDEIPTVAEVDEQWPLHVHLSEQIAENESCLAAYGMTPTALLDDAGALSARTTAVHATHLTAEDITALGRSATYSCFCPTTERDLADGIGPARALHDAGSPLSLGSDQHVVIDPFEELRGLEMHERLVTNERDRFSANDLLLAASFNGYRSLGWSDGGHLSKGALADFVTVRTDTVNTAGAAQDQIIYACVASDVSTVVVGGDVVVSDGHHRMGDVGRMLVGAIDRVAGGVPV
jgi:formiminoglutamate deiminase